MFISSPGGQNHLKTTELQEATKSAPVPEREKKRHQYLFQSQPLQKNKTIYQHVVRMVSQFINQITGRQQEQQLQGSKYNKTHNATEQYSEQQSKPRQIRGIADRMPRLVDPENPKPRRDSVFIGESKDYPAAVIGIEYDGDTHPVFYEGNQIVARHLHLDSEEASIDGQLILNDGRRFPVEIIVITAV